MKAFPIVLVILALSHKYTSASHEGCSDTANNCQYVTEYCSRSQKVKELCPKSCGICNQNPDCECGISNEPIIERSPEGSKVRIVGGRVALKNKYPWLVSLNMRGSMCGGSIINSRYILTAGHCTYYRLCKYPVRAQDIIVTVAEHNVHSFNDDIKGVTEKIRVEKIIRHEKYCLVPGSMTSYDNDIALLLLPRDIDLSPKELGLPCLPPAPYTTYVGKTVTVAGWGLNKPLKRNQLDVDAMATDLLEVSFKVMENCDLYPYSQHITENMFCAGDPRRVKDSCGGDSGGPLMYKDQNNRYTQVGIVSFGPPGGNCTGVGVYTIVAHYIDWIRDNTRDGKCQI